MTTVFFVMIVFMGWMLPTSMTVYWIASSLVSVAQTLISQKLLGNKSKKDLMNNNNKKSTSVFKKLKKSISDLFDKILDSKAK